MAIAPDKLGLQGPREVPWAKPLADWRGPGGLVSGQVAGQPTYNAQGPPSLCLFLSYPTTGSPGNLLKVKTRLIPMSLGESCPRIARPWSTVLKYGVGIQTSRKGWEKLPLEK